MKQLLWLVLLLAIPFGAFADTYRCNNCGRQVTKLFAVRGVAGVAGEKKMICAACYTLAPRCAICRLPLNKDNYKQLDDGRLICTEDFAVGIFAQQDLDEVISETRRELERVFYRFSMKFSEQNVKASLVPANRIYELVGARYNPGAAEINGFTLPKFFNKAGEELSDIEVVDKPKEVARTEYEMYLVCGLPRARLMAVVAHELGHVWHLSNLKLDRSFHLENKTREAFCELVSYQLMDAMNQPFEKAVIEANLYTYGQAELLIETEKDYGFNRILEWMKNGHDLHLSRDDLDRIRMVDNGQPITAPAPVFSGFVAPAPVKVPDTLLLKGIMGSGNKKLALINNQTFSPSETAKVKVGTTNISVQVVEIREKSVIIRTNGATQTQELLLQ